MIDCEPKKTARRESGGGVTRIDEALQRAEELFRFGREHDAIISRDSADNAAVPRVRLANAHRIKGLEFKAVFLVGIKDGVVPLEYALSRTDDPVEQRARELNERALLHVAGTRAVHSLYVTYSGEPSRLIGATSS